MEFLLFFLVSDGRPSLKQSSDPLGPFFVFLNGFSFRTINFYVSRRDFSGLIMDWIEKKSFEKLQLSSTTLSSSRRKCSMSPNHEESDFGDGFEASIMADS
ncbi:hypothetical protein AAC387_Pa06g2290 [Persea americana]